MHANDTCIQCHSQGRPLKNPIEGKYYDWPVGFCVGLTLADFWKLEEHKLGETTFTHFARRHRAQEPHAGQRFRQSLMYTRGVTCFTCHDAHGTDNPADLREAGMGFVWAATGRTRRTGRMRRRSRSTPITRPGSAGSECVACHMPKIAQTIDDVYVRSHTFRFVTPAETDDEDSQRLQRLPHGQAHRLGDSGIEKLERPLSVAGAIEQRA